MDIRQAILKAADWIEGNPRLFKYEENFTPYNCHTPGCALGWVDYFHGATRRHECLDERGWRLFNVPYWDFRNPDSFMKRMSGLDFRWKEKAEYFARALRLYADKYHPIVTPDWEAMAKPGAAPVQRVTET
jgi:hypothetical protein